MAQDLKTIDYNLYSHVGLKREKSTDDLETNSWNKFPPCTWDCARFQVPDNKWDAESYNVHVEFVLVVGESEDLHLEEPSVIGLVSISSRSSSNYCIHRYFNHWDNGNSPDKGNGQNNYKGLNNSNISDNSNASDNKNSQSNGNGFTFNSSDI